MPRRRASEAQDAGGGRSGVLVAGTATAGVAVMSGGNDAAPAAQQPQANTVTVQPGKLSDMVSPYRTVTYRARSDGSPYAVINQARGTYTELPDDGDKIDCGSVLCRVDDEPVLLLCGTVPAYRYLRRGDAGHEIHGGAEVVDGLGGREVLGLLDAPERCAQVRILPRAPCDVAGHPGQPRTALGSGDCVVGGWPVPWIASGWVDGSMTRCRIWSLSSAGPT